MVKDGGFTHALDFDVTLPRFKEKRQGPVKKRYMGGFSSYVFANRYRQDTKKLPAGPLYSGTGYFGEGE